MQRKRAFLQTNSSCQGASGLQRVKKSIARPLDKRLAHRLLTPLDFSFPVQAVSWRFNQFPQTSIGLSTSVDSALISIFELLCGSSRWEQKEDSSSRGRENLYNNLVDFNPRHLFDHHNYTYIYIFIYIKIYRCAWDYITICLRNAMSSGIIPPVDIHALFA